MSEIHKFGEFVKWIKFGRNLIWRMEEKIDCMVAFYGSFIFIRSVGWLNKHLFTIACQNESHLCRYPCHCYFYASCWDVLIEISSVNFRSFSSLPQKIFLIALLKIPDRSVRTKGFVVLFVDVSKNWRSLKTWRNVQWQFAHVRRIKIIMAAGRWITRKTRAMTKKTLVTFCSIANRFISNSRFDLCESSKCWPRALDCFLRTLITL